MKELSYSVDFLEGHSACLPSAAEPGAFLYTTDEKELYRSNSAGKIEPVGAANLEKGSGDNSVQQKTSIASSMNCFAGGQNNIAGFTGLAIKKVEFSHDISNTFYRFYLSDTRFEDPQDIDLVKEVVSKWEIRDTVTAFYRYSFYNCGTIAEIHAEGEDDVFIIVDMGYTVNDRELWEEVFDEQSFLETDANGLFNMSRQEVVGPWDGGNGCTAFGLENKSSGYGSFVAGSANTGYGNYCAVFGTNNINGSPQTLVSGELNKVRSTTGSNIVIGYNNNVVGNTDSSAVFGSSHYITQGRTLCSGYKNRVSGYCGAAIGEELIVNKNYQTVVGKHNKTGEYLFAVGCGTSASTSDRKNALEVYEDRVKVAKAEMEELTASDLKNIRNIHISDCTWKLTSPTGVNYYVDMWDVAHERDMSEGGISATFEYVTGKGKVPVYIVFPEEFKGDTSQSGYGKEIQGKSNVKIPHKLTFVAEGISNVRGIYITSNDCKFSETGNSSVNATNTYETSNSEVTLYLFPQSKNVKIQCCSLYQEV